MHLYLVSGLLEIVNDFFFVTGQRIGYVGREAAWSFS